MKTSRQRLLEYIQLHGVVTAEELSQVLRMTPANARHHLAILQDQGAVKVIGERPTGGRGRPAQLFALAQAINENNLQGLTAALLDELLQELSDEARRSYLQKLGLRLLTGAAGSAVSEALSPQGSLTRRLFTAVQLLNALRYQARWEAHAQAPRLILGHCPYAALVDTHPELCEMDAAILERLLGQPVQQTACRALDARNLPYCMFLPVSRVGPDRLP